MISIEVEDDMSTFILSSSPPVCESTENWRLMFESGNSRSEPVIGIGCEYPCSRHGQTRADRSPKRRPNELA